MRTPVLIAIALALAAPAGAQRSGGFTVAETGRSFARLQDAVDSLNNGNGTIRIAPGRYRDCAVQEGGNLSFVAERPGTAIFERVICEDKAALVLRGESARVEGIVFSHLIAPDGNGAGIRIEKGDLTVANAMFVDSQCGILSAPDPSSTISVDRSTFSGLGKDPTGNGAHSLYVGEYAGLRVTRSRFERGQGGHYVKTRAPKIEMVGNSFDDTQGSHTNYMVDLSNGAVGRIAANVFVVGANKDNHGTLITVAPEGARNVSDGLVVENNTASLAPGVEWRPALVGNWARENVLVRGNKLGRGIAAMEDR